jgi:hypothetical protein
MNFLQNSLSPCTKKASDNTQAVPAPWQGEG